MLESNLEENFDNFRKHILPRTYRKGTLCCGSLYEQPIEYAMLNLTDLDRLGFDRQIFAAAENEVISKHFRGEILTIETDNCHLGFARLFRRLGKKRKCIFWNTTSYQGPAIKENILRSSQVNDIFRNVSKFKPNVRFLETLTLDNVFSFICPSWPLVAAEWRNRKRHNGWPSRDLIDKIVRGGCHLVRKSHESNPNDGICWRFSFSQAELILLNSWNDVQAYIYHILRIVKSDVIAKCGGEKQTFLCTYYFKTLMLWACEERSSQFWNENEIEAAIKVLILQMIEWLIEKNCPNYFIRENNMLDFRSDQDSSKEVKYLHDALQAVPMIVAKEPKVYCGKTLRVTFSDKASLLCMLALERHIFLNVMNQRRERYVLKSLATSDLLSHEVEDLFKAIQLHHLLMTDLPSYCDRRNNSTYKNEALSYFEKSYKRKVTGRYSYTFISSLDSILCTINKLLNGTPTVPDQRMCCYHRTGEVNSTKDATEALFSTIASMIDRNHEHPSFYISAAYYANFYYTGLRDYKQASTICEEAVAYYKKSDNSISLNVFESGFSNEILCVFINCKNADIFDAGIQVVFGFLVLCMVTLKQTEERDLDPRSLSYDLAFQVCPVELLHYIQVRCENMLHPNNARRFFVATVQPNNTELRELSNAILSAAFGVCFVIPKL